MDDAERLGMALGSRGAAEIAIERERQLQRWGLEHDLEEHQGCELACAAVALLLADRGVFDGVRLGALAALVDKHDGDDYARRLAIAGALIAAELDRVRAITR